MVRPAAVAASAARIPGPPELPITATRGPDGNGCSVRTRAASSMSCIEAMRSTPLLRNAASTATSDDAAAAVCDWPPRWPAALRPDLMARIGVLRETRRAMRAKRWGSPRDSRYIPITRMPGSRSHRSRRSLPLTSALLPTEMNCETPIPQRCAAETNAIPNAPDCAIMPSLPGSIGSSANVAFKRTPGSVLISPTQLGPTIRMP